MLEFAHALIRVFAAATFLGGTGVFGTASAAQRAPDDDVGLSGAAIVAETESPLGRALEYSPAPRSIKQRLCVGMARLSEYCRDRAGLANLARSHDDDVVGDVA